MEIMFSKPFQGHNHCYSWKIDLIGVLKFVNVVRKERKTIAILHTTLHLFDLSVPVRGKKAVNFSLIPDGESVS
ncbi:unnamed protein product [Sphenostylis stenocarpa]|uniref:Uncharacterized protein n=1 Tax=Sphenostylis stenocarpa TaxID=92480 RepID=A0AA86S6M2_9FABA|nr:unnamed protein product [Sphenostylis stenocarpa]